MAKTRAKVQDLQDELFRKSAVPKPFQVPAAVSAELLRLGTLKTASAGTILFRLGQEPNGVFLVMEGRVALSSGEDPVRVTRIAEKGSLLGLPATVQNHPYSLTAEAVSYVKLCHISPSKFRKLLATNTELGLTVVNMLAEEISVLRKLAVYKA